MGFDITIHYSLNSEYSKMINSVKAAYLYADNVRLYDFYINDVCIENSRDAFKEFSEKPAYIKGILKGFECYGSSQNSNPDEVLREWYRCLRQSEKEDPKELKRYIDFYYFVILECIQTVQRENEGVDDCQEQKYIDIIKQLGIKKIDITSDVIRPVFSLELLRRISKLYIEDKGFKLVDANPPFFNTAGLPTAISPAMLSEFSISLLPGFEEATIDEIIDIRKELDRYIIPYRAAVLRMAQTIKEVPNSESFQQECMYLYLRDIEPKVAAINAAIDDNNVFKNIAKKVITNKETWASIGALAMAFATTGDIANAVSIGAATALGGLSIAEGVVSTLEEKKKIKDNEMFFLYEAGQRLKK